MSVRPRKLATRHGSVALPIFLPDATRAVVRALDSRDLRHVGVEALVVNTFHLLRAPGARLIKSAGGIHAFMGWDGPVISDSGGFQVFSLIRQNPDAGTIRANEVIFREPSTGEKVLLTPEKCVQLQLQLDSDVVMCLDDCTSVEDDAETQEHAVERTVRWARRCKAEFEKLTGGRSSRPLLFGVVQGGASETLRRQCAADLAALGLDGFGYGGWPIGPDGSLLSEPMRIVADAAPTGAPLHALGVGRPDHVVRAAALGYTIFDCALPTRDARHHRLYAFLPGHEHGPFDADVRFYEAVYILDQKHANDFGPIDASCDAACCARYSRAYLRHLFKVQDVTAQRLASMHNLRFYTRLIEGLRRSPDRPPTDGAPASGA
ncbi:MAG TPA: tRNA guanosine(34) transglycosylase Tgt [Chloroflexota bacterium]|nr:tRNA guanosine(34) transglycosylase Tgt [Chloroflexota bacterium]